MTEYYLTRQRRARIDWWSNSNVPPKGVHGLFWNPAEGVQAGYVSTPASEKIIQVGQYLLTWEDTGEQDVLSYRDVHDSFVKVIE